MSAARFDAAFLQFSPQTRSAAPSFAARQPNRLLFWMGELVVADFAAGIHRNSAPSHHQCAKHELLCKSKRRIYNNQSKSLGRAHRWHVPRQSTPSTPVPWPTLRAGSRPHPLKCILVLHHMLDKAPCCPRRSSEIISTILGLHSLSHYGMRTILNRSCPRSFLQSARVGHQCSCNVLDLPLPSVRLRGFAACPSAT